MDKYIGISEERLHHILNVARECYKIAKSEGFHEDFCRKMFMIGWNHDVGYEFSVTQEEHPKISSEMIHQMVGINNVYDVLISKKANDAIYYHGKCPDESLKRVNEWRILNIADMTIDSKGNKVTVSQRLDDIKNRYGEDSDQYLTAYDIACQIGLQV